METSTHVHCCPNVVFSLLPVLASRHVFNILPIDETMSETRELNQTEAAWCTLATVQLGSGGEPSSYSPHCTKCHRNPLCTFSCFCSWHLMFFFGLTSLSSYTLTRCDTCMTDRGLGSCTVTADVVIDMPPVLSLQSAIAPTWLQFCPV